VVVAIGYVLCAGSYILLSDYLVELRAPDPASYLALQRTKGIAYVAATGMLLFLFAWHLYRRLYRSATRLLQTQQALLDAERRATAGVLSLAVAHDSNNLLQILRSNASLLAMQRERLDAAGQGLLDAIQGAIGRLGTLIEQMRLGGRRSALARPTRIELSHFVEDSLRILRHHDRLRQCSVALVAPEPVQLTVYPAVLHDALVNLLLNAGDAVNGQGSIDVLCTQRNGAVVIEVHDDGPGVAPDMRNVLFEAFQTSKPHGTGLGLLSVKTCAQLHGGHAEYQPSPKGGACFRMVLHSVETAHRGGTAGPPPPLPR
jgi:C4-dicarboxylate-specific signal transduction histidine kinase